MVGHCVSMLVMFCLFVHVCLLNLHSLVLPLACHGVVLSCDVYSMTCPRTSTFISITRTLVVGFRIGEEL